MPDKSMTDPNALPDDIRRAALDAYQDAVDGSGNVLEAAEHAAAIAYRAALARRAEPVGVSEEDAKRLALLRETLPLENEEEAEDALFVLRLLDAATARAQPVTQQERDAHSATLAKLCDERNRLRAELADSHKDRDEWERRHHEQRAHVVAVQDELAAAVKLAADERARANEWLAQKADAEQARAAAVKRAEQAEEERAPPAGAKVEPLCVCRDDGCPDCENQRAARASHGEPAGVGLTAADYRERWERLSELLRLVRAECPADALSVNTWSLIDDALSAPEPKERASHEGP